MNKISFKAKLLIVGVVAAIAALPAVGQEAPESLLPPGFGEPAAPPAGNSQGTAPDTTARAPARDTAPRPSSAAGNPGRPANAPANKDADAAAGGEEGEDDEATDVVAVFDVPPAGRRSLGQIGVISAAAGGFPVDAFGSVNGAY
ncbi:MAG: hypothetical protein KAZ17_03030, partial [Sphingorhabdus sp.]|nr:hypothetical protein [Sphingorhabdus sp.]